MRVLVTGGAGFIGSHACLALLQKGYEVVVFDSFVNSNKKSIQKVIEILKGEKLNKKINIEIVNGDIRDEKLLNQLFSKYHRLDKPIEAVIHFAGLKSVYESVLNPLEYWDVNVSGTRNLLNTMAKNNCYSIVFSSSATVYGLSESIPINEAETISPMNPYGETKVAVETMLTDLYQSDLDLWRIISLRYFNPVGAHNSGLIGEDPKGIPNNLFPIINQIAIGKRSSLQIFGNDWDTRDGTGIRDYIHVMDLAEGHTAALKYILSGNSINENINLGSGKGFSVLEIINEFQKVTKCKINYDFVDRRNGDIAVSVADISKAKKLINWIPTKSLAQIILDGWNWQKKNPNGYG
jgi:UDP-glucose 4-epimerase